MSQPRIVVEPEPRCPCGRLVTQGCGRYCAWHVPGREESIRPAGRTRA